MGGKHSSPSATTMLAVDNVPTTAHHHSTAIQRCHNFMRKVRWQRKIDLIVLEKYEVDKVIGKGRRRE
jgi:hypothetical protein